MKEAAVDGQIMISDNPASFCLSNRPHLQLALECVLLWLDGNWMAFDHINIHLVSNMCLWCPLEDQIASRSCFSTYGSRFSIAYSTCVHNAWINNQTNKKQQQNWRACQEERQWAENLRQQKREKCYSAFKWLSWSEMYLHLNIRSQRSQCMICQIR